jgi:hypothetical protein
MGRRQPPDLPIIVRLRPRTIRTGRHLSDRESTPLNKLFLSMMDRKAAKVVTLGDSTGRLEGLTRCAGILIRLFACC